MLDYCYSLLNDVRAQNVPTYIFFHKNLSCIKVKINFCQQGKTERRRGGVTVLVFVIRCIEDQVFLEKGNLPCQIHAGIKVAEYSFSARFC